MQRSRDRLGRPLADDADPALAVAPVPEAREVTAADAWTQALGYLAQGLPFHAHEVLEQRWRCCPGDERATWRSLAQWAAALTHQARGNRVGAERVARRAADVLADCTVVPEPIDSGLVRASLERVIAESASPGSAGLT